MTDPADPSLPAPPAGTGDAARHTALVQQLAGEAFRATPPAILPSSATLARVPLPGEPHPPVANLPVSTAIPAVATPPVAPPPAAFTGETFGFGEPVTGLTLGSLPTTSASLPLSSSPSLSSLPTHPAIPGEVRPPVASLPTGSSFPLPLETTPPSFANISPAAAQPSVQPRVDLTPPHHPESASPTSAADPFLGTTLRFGEPAALISPALSSSTAHSGIPHPTDEPAPSFYFLQETPRPAAASTPVHPPAPLDVHAIRRDFPALHQKIHGHPLAFLDNAATTQKPRAVLDAMSRFYERDYSNIHRAAYELAERATAAFESAREKVARFLGARTAREIVFTRNATESINLVARTFGKQNLRAGDEILLTVMEHHANIVPWQLLAEEVGAVLRVVPITDRGELRVEEFARLLGPRVKMAAVTHVSNALGTINPLELLIPLAHARGIPVLVDGSQSTPHLPVNVQALDADFFVFSGHKVFGPTGIGVLYAKGEILRTLPPYQGGGHMIRDVRFERTIFQDPPEKFEAGTPDIAGAIGLGAALDYLFQLGIPNLAAYEHSLLEYATPRLAAVPGLRPIGTAPHKASVLAFVIPGVPNEKIAAHLDRHGIAVRAGHHCALPTQRHFGLESTVRPSLAFYNTREEIDRLISALHTLPRS
ncbi:MAG: SufS family cysteine desulfurase [Terrimicrobiaceae bacterium]